MLLMNYFGTDGIRGQVGQAPMEPHFVLNLGWAIAQALAVQKVIVGRDTRQSGPLLQSALQAGLMAAGCQVMDAGILPTPAIAYLVQNRRADAGIIISASHNPHQDNGIKLFDAQGLKLSDQQQRAIEQALNQPLVWPEVLGQMYQDEQAQRDYQQFCLNTAADLDLSGYHIVLDCAHGATYAIAPKIFKQLGAEVHSIGIAPDGRNINQGCGATQMQALQQAVLAKGADLGLAFDGDGDRLMLVDEQGQVHDGDAILYLIALDLKQKGLWQGDLIGTVMSNLGFEQALARQGIKLKRVPVGDRHIVAALNRGQGILGGEPSGHIIYWRHSPTGDGIIAALQLLRALKRRRLSEALQDLHKTPQVLLNVPLGQAQAEHILQNETVQQQIKNIERELGQQGRLLLRPSGTEPLLRIMIEGPSKDQIQIMAQNLAHHLQEVIHAG